MAQATIRTDLVDLRWAMVYQLTAGLATNRKPAISCMLEATSRLLIIGASVRAAAASAVRAGLDVFAIDRFGDADLQRLASYLPIEHWPCDVARMAGQLPPMNWMYCGGIENEPALISSVSQGHRLLGCGPGELKSIRDPFWIEATLAAAGLPTLRHRRDFVPADPTNWLIKPLRGGGGQEIRFAETTARLSQNSYFQEFRDGRSISALFVSAKNGATLIGISEQLIGCEFGAPTQFAYAGSVGPISVSESARGVIAQIGRTLAGAASLRGLFGIDFILADDVPWLTEVNPRYTASAEIYERATRTSLIQWHAVACESFHAADRIITNRDGPQLTFPACEASHEVSKNLMGKLIVFADVDLPVINSHVPFELVGEAADLPVLGSRITAGWPICTVFAAGRDPERVKSDLLARAASLRESLR